MNKKRNLKNSDVVAIWKVLGKKYGVKPVNYSSTFGKILRSIAKTRFHRVSSVAKDLIGTKLCFFKYVLLDYEPMSGKRPALTEILHAVHETTHRLDQKRDKSAVNWYKNYFRHRSHRATAELNAIRAEMSIRNLLGTDIGNSYIRHKIETLRNGYFLDAESLAFVKKELQFAFLQIINSTVLTNDVAWTVAHELIRLGVIEE